MRIHRPAVDADPACPRLSDHGPGAGRRPRRRHAVGLAALVVAALGVGACGSSPATSGAAPAPEAPATTQAAPTGSGSGPEQGDQEFCSIFQGLSDRRQAQGEGGGPRARDGFQRYTDEASWDRGIEQVARIAEVAPAEIRPQAETYVELVEARKELAAAHGYGTVPDEAALEFGRAHAAEQQQANQLIAFAKEHCEGVV